MQKQLKYKLIYYTYDYPRDKSQILIDTSQLIGNCFKLLHFNSVPIMIKIEFLTNKVFCWFICLLFMFLIFYAW